MRLCPRHSNICFRHYHHPAFGVHDYERLVVEFSWSAPFFFDQLVVYSVGHFPTRFKSMFTPRVVMLVWLVKRVGHWLASIVAVTYSRCASLDYVTPTGWCWILSLNSDYYVIEARVQAGVCMQPGRINVPQRSRGLIIRRYRLLPLSFIKTDDNLSARGHGLLSM